MKILQYNCQSLRKNSNNIDFFVNSKKYQVVCLSEVFSHGDDSKSKNLLNFNLIQKKREDGYGGVAIALLKSIKFKSINYSTDHDICIVQTKNLLNNLTICSIYCEPSMELNTFKDLITHLFNFLDRFRNVLIMLARVNGATM